jgi:peptidoglycan/LPS O-acetylase OafA/YrhL
MSISVLDRRPAATAESPSDGVLAYRPYIDGLRAVSIVAVVGYHIGLPAFGGGFVGVDVFFVISGFLIIGQIAAAIRAGRFSFTAFYARRVLRILPPLLLVLLASIAVAPLVLVTPREYSEFGRSVVASALIYANHYFLGQEGYFDTRSDLKPLLHLWTLSVEEQFYLVVPAILLLLARLAAARRRPLRDVWLASTAIITVLSLIGCILLTRHSRNYGFYLMPLRGWEFMVGGALGIGLPAGPRLIRHSGSLAWAGLAAILVAIVLLGSVGLYPSGWALVPAGGAALVIWAGLLSPGNTVARLLSLRVPVAIGLVSYSWYLWHWPLLAFTRIAQFGDRRLGSALAIALLSLLLATATYWAIERPARAWRHRAQAQRGWTVAAGVLACAGCAGLGLGLADIIAPQVARSLPPGLQPSVETSITQDDSCAIRNDPRLDSRCLAEAGGARFGLLLGDSHARALYRVLRAETEHHGQRLISLLTFGCPPLLSPAGNFSASDPVDCARRNDAGLRSIAAVAGDRLGFAVIEAAWLYYGSYRELVISGAMPTGEFASAAVMSRFADRLAETIQRLIDMHVRRIILVGPVPIAPRSVPACLIRADRQGGDRNTLCAFTRAQAERLRGPVVAMLQAAARRFDAVRYVDPIDSFCDSTTCRSAEGNVALLADQQHLTEAGTRRLLDGASAVFLWAFGATAPGQ